MDFNKTKFYNNALAFGDILIAFLLITMAIAPIFTKQEPLIADDPPNSPEFYTYVAPTEVGTFGYWKLNRTMARLFVKDNFKWRAEASANGNNWHDASSLLTPALSWDNENNTYKVDLILNTTGAPTNLYYRFSMAMNKTLKNYSSVSNHTWELHYEGQNRSLHCFFNWSDVIPLLENNTVTVNKGVTNNFFWFRIKTVNKIAPDKEFTIDPCYGFITQSTISSFEFDAQEGRFGGARSLVRLNDSEYYLTCATGDTGTDYDGFIRTLHIWDNNGTIQQSVVETWEYCTSNSLYANIQHVPGTDIYAIAFSCSFPSVMYIYTIHVKDDGDITQSTIDTEASASRADSLDFLRLTSDIYVISYREYTSDDGFIETYKIHSTGMIDAGPIDTVEFADANTVWYPRLCKIDDGTIIVAYADVDYDGQMVTYNISSSGDITNVATDTWEFDTNHGYHPCVENIDGVVYAIAYDGAFGVDGQIKTFNVSNAGTITKSWVDNLRYDTDSGRYPTIFAVNDNSVYGVVYQGSGTDGWITTMNISSTGVIGNSKINSYEFDSADCKAYAPIAHVSGNYYLIAYEGPDYDGWAKTVEIETPSGNTAPTFSAEAPTNASTGVSTTPTCGVVCTDADSDTMTVNFYENSTGSFLHRQKNSTVSTGTNVTWSFTQASAYNTKYWWKITCDDGTANSSAIYHFTTKSLTWQTISSTIGDGTLANTTSWQIVSNTIGDGTLAYVTSWQIVTNTLGDGTLANTTSWHIISNTIGDGTLSNPTEWQTITDTTGDGTLSNTTSWHIVSSTIGDGTLANTLTWHIISNNIGDGELGNQTYWHTISNTIGGGFISNATSWHIISDTIGNGALSNTTMWQTISTTIGDGTLANITIATWQVVSNTTGDGILSNTTIWHTVSNTIGDGALGNTTHWHTISSTIGDGTLASILVWNTVSDTIGDGTLANQLIWHIISNNLGDGELGNITYWHIICNNRGDGTLGNTTSWKTISDTLGDGSISNVSVYWRVVSATIGDGTLGNISYLYISNPLPADGATGECPCCISLSIDIISKSCNTINITFYSNLSGDWEYFYIGTDDVTYANVPNGTYIINVPFFNQYNYTYYWNVTIADAVTTRTSPIYSFKTALNKAECDPPISNETWIAGLAIMFGGLGIIFAIRRKRRNRYEE